MSTIQKASAARRGDCFAFVEEFVERYAADASQDELARTWRRLVQEYPWYAEDVLHCLDAVLGMVDRPLPALVCDVAQLNADGDADDRQLSHAQRQDLGIEWLSHLLGRFRPVFEELSRSDN